MDKLGIAIKCVPVVHAVVCVAGWLVLGAMVDFAKHPAISVTAYALAAAWGFIGVTDIARARRVAHLDRSMRP